MEKFQFYLPTRIFFERGLLARIGDFALSMGKKCFFITMSEFATKYGYTEYILGKLSERELPIYLFDEVESNPSKANIKRATEMFIQGGCDMIVAFGGGSVIDAAKAVSLLSSQGGKIEDYFFPNIVEKEVYPIIAIPTTCGTGSEVTKYSIITDEDTCKKKTIMGDPLIPKMALLDADNLKYITKEIVATTGADVLSHAIEAYLSIKHSPFSDMFASDAAKVAFEHLVQAYNGVEESREQMLYASCLGGAAINFAGTTVAHALGYYVTAKHGIPHGLASAIFLPSVMNYELESARGRIEKLAYTAQFNMTDAQYFIKRFSDILRDIGLPTRLRELGINESEKKTIVQEALSFKRNLENNPILLEEKDLTKIVEDIF